MKINHLGQILTIGSFDNGTCKRFRSEILRPDILRFATFQNMLDSGEIFESNLNNFVIVVIDLWHDAFSWKPAENEILWQYQWTSDWMYHNDSLSIPSL